MQRSCDTHMALSTFPTHALDNRHSPLIMNGVEWQAGHQWGPVAVHASGNVASVQQDGQAIPGQANWNVNLNCTYLVMDGNNHVQVHAWMRQQGRVLLADRTEEEQAASGILNLESTWNRRSQPWQLTVGVRNVLDA